MNRTLNSKPLFLTRLGSRVPVHGLPVYVSIGLLLAALGNASPLPRSTGDPIPPQPTLVAVVSGDGESEMNMDAVVIVRGAKLSAPYLEQSETAQKKFAREYFQTGQKYRVTFGGGEVGSATVKKSDTGCNNIHATVSVETTAKIHGQVKALATNSSSLGKRSSARRAPTDTERRSVMTLVDSIYWQKVYARTPPHLRAPHPPASWIKVTNLTATDLDGDGKYELIGSFTHAAENKFERDLFLIAHQQGTAMRADFVKFQAYQPPPEGFLSSIDFVDQLDLDGDGTSEVFAVQGGFDAYGYLIFKRLGGRWRQVYSAMGDAC